MKQSLRIIFMGTSSFAVPILKSLLKSGNVVTSVFTKEIKRLNYSRHLTKSPVHRLAESFGLSVSVLDLTEFQEEELTKFKNCDVVIISDYGLILPKPLLEVPKFGCFNIHASLLPRWRGASPIQRSIQAGDLETGVTIIKIVNEIDAGPILLRKKILIKNKSTSETLYKDLSSLGASLISQVIERINLLNLQPQSSEVATYAEKIRKSEGYLNWEKDAFFLECTIRAFKPWPGTFFYLKGRMIKVHEAEVVNQLGIPGEVLSVNGLIIACGKNSLKILKIQPSGGRVMNTKDFLNGYSIKVGTRL